MGYYEVLDDNKGIACTLSPPGSNTRVIYKVDGATDYYINNQYEPDSDYSFMLSGGRARMSGLSGYFLENGGHLPRVDRVAVPWSGVEGDRSTRQTSQGR